MLTIYDLDENTVKLKSRCPAIMQKMYDVFTELPLVNVKHAVDIAGEFSDMVILVMRGIFKAYYNDKFIRFYKMGDIITSPFSFENGPVKILSEMASDVKMFTSSEFISAVNATAEKRDAWFEYSKIQQQLLFGICGALINNDEPYDINLKTFNPGEQIIKEGEFPDCLYEMIDGDAIVTAKGKEIGRINKAEIFGEVSFLTGMNRTASVTANSTCLVQCIEGEHFQAITRQRPAMVKKMAQTIAIRLADVNDKLVNGKKVT